MAMTDNLLSYYKLDETSGTRVDSHGSKNLLDINTVGSATGIISNAADLVSGSSERLVSGTSTGFTGHTNFSISFWINHDATTDDRQPLTVFGATGGTWSWRAINASSKLQFQIYDGTNLGSITPTSTFTTGTWYHTVYTFDGSQASGSRGKVYINGSDNTSADDTPAGMQTTTTAFIIGNRDGFPGGGFFDGRVDEVGIWSRTLTSSEITGLYNSGSGVAYEDLDTIGGGGGDSPTPTLMMLGMGT